MLCKGRLIMDGDTKTVCDAYSKYLDTGVLPELPQPEKSGKSAAGAKPAAKK